MRFTSVARSTRSCLCVSCTRRRAWSTVHVVPIASHVDDVDVDCCTVCCSNIRTRSRRPCVVRLPCLSAFCCLTGGIGAHVCCVYRRAGVADAGGRRGRARRGASETREVESSPLGCKPDRVCSVPTSVPEMFGLERPARRAAPPAPHPGELNARQPNHRTVR